MRFFKRVNMIIISILCLTLMYCFDFCNSDSSHNMKSEHKSILDIAIDKITESYALDNLFVTTKKLSFHENYRYDNMPLYSSIQGLCDHLHINETDRLACCSKYPLPFYYLHNVKIEDQKLIFYVRNQNEKPPQLPAIISLIRRQQHLFNMDIEVREGSSGMDLASCSSYYNGTLHIAGRYTTHNLFHVLNDNIIPLLSQIVFDIYLRKHMLSRPRALLEGFQPKDTDELPHISILKKIVSTSFILKSANNMCFHTIVWGNGMKLVYTHLLGALRRVIADLLREIISIGYNPVNPYTTATATATMIMNEKEKESLRMVEYSLYSQNNHIHNIVRRPMNIVIFTRGSSGEGRSMAGEKLLQKRLSDLGAIAYICCDFKSVSLTKQLSYAFYADVIIGLHGAGLVNNFYAPKGVITVELKTIYGYDLTLFAVTGESRLGSHIELNIKPYHQWGKPVSKNKPMDEMLIGRITSALYNVIARREIDYNQIISIRNKFQRQQHWEMEYLKKLSNYDFRKYLFETLPSHEGDIIMHAYPLQYYEQIRNNYHGNITYLQSIDKILAHEKYDFLLHLLGPKSNQHNMLKQCQELVISSYWIHIKADTSRFCLPCQSIKQLQLQRQVYNPKSIGSNTVKHHRSKGGPAAMKRNNTNKHHSINGLPHSINKHMIP